MKFNQPVTIQYIEDGGWFLFGGIQNNNTISIVVASLEKIMSTPLMLSPKEERDNQLSCFKTLDVSTFESCPQVVLPRGVIEVQVDKGVYRVIGFDNEDEEAKFCLLNSWR